MIQDSLRSLKVDLLVRIRRAGGRLERDDAFEMFCLDQDHEPDDLSRAIRELGKSQIVRQVGTVLELVKR